MSNGGNRTNERVISWMRFVCRYLYWCGLGDCWYEPSIRSMTHRIAYAVFSCLSNAFVVTMVCFVIASLFRNTLTVSERKDCIQFSIAHPLIVLKCLYVRIQQPNIKILLEKLLVTTREIFYDEDIEKKQIRKSKMYCTVLAASMYMTLFSTTIDAVVGYFNTGIPWRTMVTFYPDATDVTWSAYIVRTVTTYYWFHLVIGMLATDFLAINCLITVAFKFQTLQRYFESLKTNFEANPSNKSQSELEDRMHRDFIRGIKLHNEILWCARSTQKSLGNVYSFQVVQSTLLLVTCLLKLVTTGRNLTFLIATISFITCMLVLTGVYMWSAGEITHEASLVSDAMFQSGWHLCSARARMRKLLVVGIARSQVPVIMTAFGVVDLSYVNFIKIVRHSYSVFAVLY